MKISKSDRAIEERFDLFCAANSFASILSSFNGLCALTVTTPTTHPWNIYKEISTHVKPYWKGVELFKKLDKRVQSPDYMHQTVCSGVNALVIGCGPCGLRCAIELALLGARVVVVEKRSAFSRNNVLHLWPYLIEDLRSLGAKTFFGKFCVGSIDHVSIRTLQCILLKVALLFGVQVFPGVTYCGLVQPTSDIPDSFSFDTPNRLFVNHPDLSYPPSTPLMNGHSDSYTKNKRNTPLNGTVQQSDLGASRRTIGWRVKLEPEVVTLQNYEIDVLIGADGKRSCIGFPSKELRCRLAIAITANFINYHTQAETEVEEISGVASIFNQQFFARLAADTGIALENIVYYKDETHYFVMTASKQSLLAKGVLKQDQEDSERLLCSANIDQSALQAYARETANYVTNNQLPRLDFALNARGQPDVDVFDFTRIFAAEYSCRMLERKQQLLIQCLVGDGLFEPFWPTGSGCALGFLSALDAAWAVSRLASGLHPLQVLAQRESVYQRLSQTTPQNMPTNFTDYTIDPKTRYTRCNFNLFTPEQVLHLYLTDREKVTRSYSTQTLQHEIDPTKPIGNRLREQLVFAHALATHHSPTNTSIPASTLGVLRWFQIRLSFYVSCGLIDSPMDLSPEIWESGTKLLCLIHLYAPDLIPELEQFIALVSLSNKPDPSTVFDTVSDEVLVQRACELLTTHFRVQWESTNNPYPQSATEWISYLTTVHRTLRCRKFTEPKRIAVPISATETKDVPPSSTVSPIRVAKPKVSNEKDTCPPYHYRVQQNGYLDNAKSKRVFREDPNWSVEKGLLLKRRAELIATLQDPASVKRHLSVQPLSSIKKRPFVRDGSDRSKSPRSKHISLFPSYHSEQQNRLTRSRSNHEATTNPTDMARLSGSRKNAGGGIAQCHLCNKRLYSIERVIAFGSHFHRSCFRCDVCGIQLQPDEAARIRTATSDTLFCLTHSPVKSNGFSKVSRSRASSTGVVSAADRLRAVPPQPDNSVIPSAHPPQKRSSVLIKAYALENSVTGTPSAPSRPSRRPAPGVDPSKSALLAGLSDGDDAVMGVVDVRALIRNFRGVPSDSSTSPSPTRNRVGYRKPPAPTGPSGDAPVDQLRASGIRDEGAPGPDCFLAGHLGLPEVERRAILELNTTTALPDLSVSELLEHMRSNRRAIIGDGDYFASTESEDSCTACESDVLKYKHIPPLKHKVHYHTNTSSAAPCNTRPSNEPSLTVGSATGFDVVCSNPSLSSCQDDSVPNQLPPSSVMAAKRRFCMEPPKPLTIDPKQFIGNKNRERTTTNSLPDCTEDVYPIQEVAVLQHPTPPSDNSPFYLPEVLVIRDLPLETMQVPISQFVSSRTDEDLFEHFTDSDSSPSDFMLASSPTTSFVPLEHLRDIDSTSTTPQRSSTERTSEVDDVGHDISAHALCDQLNTPSIDVLVVEPPNTPDHLTRSECSDTSDTSSADLNSAAVVRPNQNNGARNIITSDECIPRSHLCPTKNTVLTDCSRNDQPAVVTSVREDSSSSSLVFGSVDSLTEDDVHSSSVYQQPSPDTKPSLSKVISEKDCGRNPSVLHDMYVEKRNTFKTHPAISPDSACLQVDAHAHSEPNLSAFLGPPLALNTTNRTFSFGL